MTQVTTLDRASDTPDTVCLHHLLAQYNGNSPIASPCPALEETQPIETWIRDRRNWPAASAAWASRETSWSASAPTGAWK